MRFITFFYVFCIKKNLFDFVDVKIYVLQKKSWFPEKEEKKNLNGEKKT